jgi:hypothetical protein
MARPKGVKCVPVTITVPIPIFKLIHDDANDPQQGYPTGNVSKIVTTILANHYKKALTKLAKKYAR